MPKKMKCAVSGQLFEVYDREAETCKKFDVPLPEISPDERMRLLMGFRNEWKLYPRKCDATGKKILSAYPADSPFKVYDNPYWWSDKWDPLKYGRAFDFSRPFYEQLRELQLAVPREGTTVFSSENCEYNSHIRESKNCYLNSLVYRCEDLYYSSWAVNDKDVFDCLLTNDSTLCYNCVNVNNAYQCVMIEESHNCNECYFSFQLKGCDHCIFCSNLANKSYQAFNKPCTKDEFDAVKLKYLNGSWKNWQEGYDEFLKMRAKTIHRAVHNLNCENCSGDHLYNCKNGTDCFGGFNSEDCCNSFSLDASKDIYSCYSAGWPGCEMVYLSLVTRGSKFIAFSNYIWFSSDLLYCDSCNACEECFGCIGLQHKKYCILNKQYTKEDYETLTKKITGHMKKTGEWGKFFPKEFSPHAYNETAADDYYPLSKEEALKNGWRWREKDETQYQPATLKTIPDNIKEAAEIEKEILICSTCGKNFRIIRQELAFYEKMGLPIPRSCGQCRHRQRFELSNPYRLFARKCDKCGANIQSSYAPERPETVYCEKCYLKAVY